MIPERSFVSAASSPLAAACFGATSLDYISHGAPAGAAHPLPPGKGGLMPTGSHLLC